MTALVVSTSSSRPMCTAPVCEYRMAEGAVFGLTLRQVSTSLPTLSRTRPKPKVSPKWPSVLATRSSDCPTTWFGTLTPTKSPVIWEIARHTKRRIPHLHTREAERIGFKYICEPNPLPSDPPSARQPDEAARYPVVLRHRVFPYPTPRLFILVWRDVPRRKANDFHNPLSSCRVLGSVVCICYLGAMGKTLFGKNCMVYRVGRFSRPSSSLIH